MPTPKEQAACRSKKRFSNSVTADAALKKINASHRLNRPTRVYKCPVCAGYHLTSQR